MLPFCRYQRQRCIKILCPKDPDLLALKTAKGQHLPALEVYKNQSPRMVAFQFHVFGRPLLRMTASPSPWRTPIISVSSQPPGRSLTQSPPPPRIYAAKVPCNILQTGQAQKDAELVVRTNSYTQIGAEVGPMPLLSPGLLTELTI